MSQSKYKSTSDTTNFARVARLLLGPCTDVLRAVLMKEISPPNLKSKFRLFIANQQKNNKSQITKTQERLVYGRDYSKFDITLLYFLLRNLCSIQPHKKQWGNDPRPSDRSVSANIERIRLIRNKYGHNSEFSISVNDFNDIWQEMFNIVKNLERHVGTSTDYQDAVIDLKTCPMDPEQSRKDVDQLNDMIKEVQYITGEIHLMKKVIVPWNMKVLHDKTISKWKEDDSLFLPFHNFQTMLEKVKSRPYVTFVGVRGSGKSATVHHIALQLQMEGYAILPIRDLRDLETYCDPHNPQVFVVDDALGMFGLDLSKFDVLNQYQDIITDPEMPETKFLLTCREVVYRNKMSANSFLFNKENVVLLHSKEHALNYEDKLKLLQRYQINADIFTSEDLASSSNMFPFLCKLFTKPEYKVYGPRFFILPIPCILEGFEEMKTRQKIDYASLVLLMAYENKLPKIILENESNGDLNEKACTFLKKCKGSRLESFEIIEALKKMEGTYTRHCETEFNFIHDSMFEITAYHFGNEFPELMIRFMSSEYIANYIKVYLHPEKAKDDKKPFKDEHNEEIGGKEEAIDLCIMLQEPQYANLGERLFKDATHGDLYTVFGNEALKHPSVIRAFIDMVEKETYEKLYKIFLSELKDTFKLNPQRSQSQPEGHGYNVGEYFNIHSLLSDKKLIGCHVKNTVRAISWVIYFGHNQLLLYIIDRVMKENKNVEDLFQTCYNRNHSRINIAEEELDVDDCAMCKLVNFLSKVKCISCLHCIVCCFKSDTNVTSDKESEVCSSGMSGAPETENDTDDDTTTTNEKDSKSEIDTYSEPVIAEQYRLLCIGCHSGDLDIVKTLLKYLNKDVLNKKIYYGRLYDNRYPLEIACSLGHLEIAKELLKAGANQGETMYQSVIGASKNGHVNVVEELIQNGANVNDHDCTKTPLIAACQEGHLKVVEVLIKAGADIYRREEKQTPLKVACQRRHLDIVKLLIKTGSDAYLKDEQNVSLPTACFDGTISIVNDYIQAGADVNLKVGVITPLTAACFSGKFRVVKDLISAGANVNLRDGDKTPLTTACREGYFDVVNILIKSGAEVNLRDEIQTPLTAACVEGYADIVKELIHVGASVDLGDGKETPLTVACKWNHLIIAKELISNKASVNLRVGDKTPLTISCYEGHVQIVQALIESGADVNLKDKHKTPLTTACYGGHLIIAELLIKAGANVNLKDTDKTPLTVACTEGQLCIVRKLIKAKAEINLRDGVRLPLTAACLKGHQNVVMELIKGGANVNLEDGDKTILTAACYTNNSNIVEYLIKSGANVNLKDKEKTPLTTACYRGRFSIVKKLLELRADINLKDSDKTPLTTACKTGHLGIVKELIGAGADVNLNDGDKTPLTTACKEKHFKLVKGLISSGANVNMKDKHSTPLITACCSGDLNIVKELIRAGADVNLKDEDKTPLIAACAKGQLEIIQELIEAKADVNQRNANETPLTVACFWGDVRIVGELIKAGADLNPKDTDKTPLTSACQQGNLRVVIELIKSGAYVNLNDRYQTPLIIACCKGYLNIVQELTKAGADVNLNDKDKTPLTAACQQGHLDIVEELIKEGVDVNLSDGNRAPLIAACEEGHLNIVKELIKAGAALNLEDGDKTILTAACYTKQLSIVEELIRSGADVNLNDKEKTPLTIACYCGHLGIVKELIKKWGRCQ